MARIVATGVPEKHPELGDVKISISGTEKDIRLVKFYAMNNGLYEESSYVKMIFDEDMKEGPSYPLCAEPYSMRCALFVLFEWFGEAESCWVEEPKHVKLEGEIEPMESISGRIY